ncbi:hypothetical protein DTO212C5_4692 [Paecilomyces variotii]|nr:hypothetical protein DTO212C5_4692 [Paecilomyces variotii]
MADDEAKAKAEKLAAAKKRVAQLQKQKKKSSKKSAAAETTGDTTPAEEPPKEDKDHAAETTENAEKEKANEPEEKVEESATEPMPEAPTSPGPEAEPGSVKADTVSDARRRQPSISVQSKMRSSSFRNSSVSFGSSSPNPLASIKSPPLPPLTPDGDSVQEVYRKQASRIEELEKENKKLEKDLEEANGRWKKTEEQLEDLREASVDVAELKDKLSKAEERASEVEKLKVEISSLQRQNSHLHKTHKSTASIAGTSQSPPSDLVQQLESKSSTIEAMELEISNLRAQLNSQSTTSNSHEEQISALEEKLSRSEAALQKTQAELTDAKNALTRAAEKAVNEGVNKTSTETLIKSQEREINELKGAKAAADKKIETLEKKLQALGNLHKESESRNQVRLREAEKAEKDVAHLRKKLVTIENENLRLKEERERARKREAVGEDNEGLDELEDEERARLERRVRELEGEVFDLRRGVWKERRMELQGEDEHAITSPAATAANTFDDVDLIGGVPDHSRRRSTAGRSQHSSITAALSSGLAAFTGGNNGWNRPPSRQHPPATRGSLELLSENDDDFDEEAFARAQAEEESRKRVEWVREVKSKLNNWKGWRLDLVDSRAGAEGAGVGMGEIFEI